MSYRCGICNAAVGDKQQRLLWPVYRDARPPKLAPGVTRPKGKPPRQELAREWAICPDCHWELSHGTTLGQLLEAHRGAGQPAAPASRGPVLFGELLSPLRVWQGPGNAASMLERHEPSPVPRCDLCGAPAGDGQVTADATLCPKCINKAK